MDSKHLKPRNVVDIKSSRADSYRIISPRINLHARTPTRQIPIREIISAGLVLVTVISLFVGSVSAPDHKGVYAAESSEERKALEAELEALENEIAQYNSVIENYRKQGNSLQSEIDALNARLDSCGCGPEECVTLDPNGYGPCDAILGVVFDGNSCVFVSGCDCAPDCDNFYNSRGSVEKRLA